MPFIISGVFQPGFSQGTPLVATLDNGLTFRGTLSNPFPDGVLEPPGAALGADTFLGQDLTSSTNNVRVPPAEFNNAQNMRYTIGVQRELPGQWLVEGAYVGSRGWDLTTGGGAQAGEIDLNGIPAQYLSTSPQRDDATNNFLTQQVTNPFRGLIPGTGVQRRNHCALSSCSGRFPSSATSGRSRTMERAATTQRSSRSRNASRGATRCSRPTPGRSSPSASSS